MHMTVIELRVTSEIATSAIGVADRLELLQTMQTVPGRAFVLIPERRTERLASRWPMAVEEDACHHPSSRTSSGWLNKHESTTRHCGTRPAMLDIHVQLFQRRARLERSAAHAAELERIADDESARGKQRTMDV